MRKLDSFNVYRNGELVYSALTSLNLASKQLGIFVLDESTDSITQAVLTDVGELIYIPVSYESARTFQPDI